MRTTLAAVLLCAACGGSKPSAIQPDPKPKAPDAGVTAIAPDAEPGPPTREQQIADALARVPAIRAKVSELRGLPSVDLPASVQSIEDFEVFVRAEAAKEYPVEEAAAEAKALAHIGVLAEPIDLVEANIGAAVSQVAAYYSPDLEEFKVVQVPEDASSFDMVSAHELTHAVQDQNFDLETFMPLDLTDDAANARRFLVEGDATLLMLMYLFAAAGADPTDPMVVGALRQQIDSFAGMDASAIGAMMGGSTDPAAIAAAALPPWIIDPMFDSYFKGARVVVLALQSGGWDAVNALYKAPPSTTEQMLHPEAKLICHREEPATIKLPAGIAGKGWSPVLDGVLGESGLRIYGKVWGIADPSAFADGWNGDRWSVVEKDGAMLGFLATSWDTPEDATAFSMGMLESFATRKIDADLATNGTRVDVVFGCAKKACKAPLGALVKLRAKEKAGKPRKAPASEAECLKKLG